MADDGGPQRGTEQDKTAKPPVLSSRDLFGSSREVIIEHGTEQYRLLITSNNKLILMK